MLFLIILSLISVNCITIAAQDPTSAMQSFPGPCPQLKVGCDYDIDKLTKGTWYQIYGSDAVHSNGTQKCIETRYHHIPEENQVHIEKYYLIDRRPIWSNATLYTTNESGILIHSPTFDQVKIITIASDPESYSVMWGCYYNPKTDTHIESGEINSRTQSVSHAIFELICTLLHNAGAQLKFHPIDRSDCRAVCTSS